MAFTARMLIDISMFTKSFFPILKSRDDGRLILRPGGKEKEPTSVGSRTQAQ